MIEHIRALQTEGVAHIEFNLRQSRREIEDVLTNLANNVLPEFTDTSNTSDIEMAS